MDNYIIGIGRHIKTIRKQNKKNISEIAALAEVSNGLISRIENGRTIPSLPVLLNIIKALDVEVAEFFKNLPETNDSTYLVSRSIDNSIIEKEEEAVGFTYKYLFGKQISSLGFEAVLLVIEPNSIREKVTTDAFEFKYILSGSCDYIIGDEKVNLNEGDSIFFDGRIPHVPVNENKEPAKMLVLYFFID